MITMSISWGDKGGRCVELKKLPPSCANCHEIWEPQPPGTLRTCPDLYMDWGKKKNFTRKLTISKSNTVVV